MINMAIFIIILGNASESFNFEHSEKKIPQDADNIFTAMCITLRGENVSFHLENYIYLMIGTHLFHGALYYYMDSKNFNHKVQVGKYELFHLNMNRTIGIILTVNSIVAIICISQINVN